MKVIENAMFLYFMEKQAFSTPDLEHFSSLAVEFKRKVHVF